MAKLYENILPENLVYNDYDSQARLDYFMQMYQNLGGFVDIPEGEGRNLDYREQFLQQAAHDAVLSAMSVLTVLIDVIAEKGDKEKPVDGEN